MNEQQFSAQIKRALDESSGRLPYRVSHRLTTARETAMTHMPVDGHGLVMRLAATHSSVTAVESGTGWRFAGVLVPLCIVVAGLFSMHAWDLSAKAEELADVQTAMLTDDVPIDTYADRGFGVFIKNTRQ